MAIFVCALALSLFAAAPTYAQDPSTYTAKKSTHSSAFPKAPGGILGQRPDLDTTLPLYLQGDQLIYDTKGNRVIAKGNVEIFYNNNILTADEVVYDQGANTLTAVGNVELRESNGNVIRADRYTLTDDFRDGFVQSLSITTSDNASIVAERAERREGNVTEFTNAKYTPCKSEAGMPPLWCISANKIVHDQAAATITYQDAFFEFFGQPVLYMPYFQHPDPSVKRKSGFLVPSYGTSEDLGFMTEVPYYFALSPSYDFTFHPAFLTKQGVLWKGDWRQRLADGEYTVKIAAIDQDCNDLPNGCAATPDEDGWRGSVQTRGAFSLSSWWKYGWDVTMESDDEFRRFYKLDSILLTDRINTAYVVGMSDRSYLGANLYHFGGLLTNDTPESESLVHPIIDHNYVFGDPVLGGELSWNSNVMSFSRDDAEPLATKHQDINRFVTEMQWRRRLTDTFGITYTPFAALRGDVYQFNNYVDTQTGEPIAEDTVTRGLATGGATVAYPWVANGAGGSHVIEPIGQIIVRQASVDQAGLPDEDAKSLVFDDTNLFETTKFSGWDRVEVGTRANVGVQYTFQAGTGGYARLLAGQSFQLAGDNAYAETVTFNPAGSNTDVVFSQASGLETDKSDYVLGAYIAPVNYFRVLSQSRFDESTLDLRREDLAAQLLVGPLSFASVYAFTAADPRLGLIEDQQDVTGLLGLRITDRWSLTGSMRYDIDQELRLTDSIGLQYLDECFMISATYAETFIRDVDRNINPDRMVMIRFEFKNLGGANYSTNVTDYMGADSPAYSGEQ